MEKESHVVLQPFLSWTFSAILPQQGYRQMQRCNGTSDQQADSDLNTALLSLVYKAVVSVRTDTNRAQCIWDFTGAPVAISPPQIHRHCTHRCLKLT